MYFTEHIYTKSPIFIQTLMLNGKACELYWERYGYKFMKLTADFEKNQWGSLTDLKEWQNLRLKRVLRAAYDYVPYYNEIFKEKRITPDDIKSVDDISILPVLTKDIIRKNFHKMISRSFPKWKQRHGHTSGTTGSPLDLVYDIDTCVAHHAADWRQKNWAGLKYGEPYASIQGRVIVPIEQKQPPFWRKNFINNQLFLSSFHLNGDNIPHYFDKLSKDNIKYLEGYPSTIYILAMKLKRDNIKYPLKAVLTSSETLYDFQREIIEDRFCCKVYDFYGMAERVVYASECNHHKGHHLNDDYGITEFLDKNNNPVKTGDLGDIVATSLFNTAMPLIRYKTNDACSLKTIKCSCGRNFSLMDDVTTKCESIISLPDGRFISPSVLTHPFKPIGNILESQIIQEKIDEIRVKIVKNNKYTMKDECLLVDALRKRLCGIEIKIEHCDSIPRTKNGKLQWVVSSIKAEF